MCVCVCVCVCVRARANKQTREGGCFVSFMLLNVNRIHSSAIYVQRGTLTN